MFSPEYCDISKNTCFEEYLPTAASENNKRFLRKATDHNDHYIINMGCQKPKIGSNWLWLLTNPYLQCCQSCSKLNVKFWISLNFENVFLKKRTTQCRKLHKLHEHMNQLISWYKFWIAQGAVPMILTDRKILSCHNSGRLFHNNFNGSIQVFFVKCYDLISFYDKHQGELF